jgi:glycosyltransferase involved in cell wall biosynthesis
LQGTSVTNQYRLLFAGRMTDLKGGSIMLTALPRIAHSLDRGIQAVFVGDGPARAAWTDQARRLQLQHPAIGVEFTGWLDADALAAAIDACHLLVMPSVWPEPFGRIGPEAGLRGIPAVAFAVGGISQWLRDGVNGHLAPGDPPTAIGLSEAVVKTLSRFDHYRCLCLGARRCAMGFTLDAHLERLSAIFADVVSGGPHPEEAA